MIEFPVSVRLRATVAFLACATLASCSSSFQRSNVAEVMTLATRLPAVMDTGGIPGLSIAVVSRGKITGNSAIGVRQAGTNQRVTDSTIFEAASLSKPLLAYMVMRLVDSGMISLDQPLSKITPLETHDPRASLVTARMVLSHRTGLQNERTGGDTLEFAFQPGTSYRYSGEAYTYLGHVLEALTRQSLSRLAARLVFNPLGMTRSSFMWEERLAGDAAVGHGKFEETRTPGRPRVARAAATLHTTATDYARFLNAVATGRGLTSSSRAALTTPVSDVGKGVHWTLGWGLEDGPTGPALWHHGDNSSSGFTAFAWLDLASERGVVYFANSTEGLGIIRPVLAEISPGAHPVIEASPYEAYDAPARRIRLAIYRSALANGADTGLALYRNLKVNGPPAAFDEGLLNAMGYQFLNLGRAADAVALFTENAKVFPSSANVYDSLGDGLAAAGRNGEAVEAYRRSVQLNPSNTHAAEMIRKLTR